MVAASWSAHPELPALIESVMTNAGYNHPVLWSRPLHVMQAPASAHGGLQMADYAAWASHRKRSRSHASHWDSIQASGRGLSDHEVF